MKKLTVLLSCLVLLGVASTPALAQELNQELSVNAAFMPGNENNLAIGGEFLMPVPKISKNLRFGPAATYELPKDEVSFIILGGVAEYDLSEQLPNLYVKGSLGYNIPKVPDMSETVSGVVSGSLSTTTKGGLAYSASLGYKLTENIAIEGGYKAKNFSQQLKYNFTQGSETVASDQTFKSTLDNFFVKANYTF